MDEKQDKIPCCAADALRSVRRVDVGGAAIGFAMLDTVFAEVAAMEIRNAAALIEEFRADERDRHSGGCNCSCSR